MQDCYSTASCHLGTARSLRMLERFYWWIGMNVCAGWFIRHWLKCRARKTTRMIMRWPIISMPLPKGLRVAVGVDYFGPLPVTPRSNTYVLSFTNRSSRRSDSFPVAPAGITEEGTANILVNQYIPWQACPRIILSDNGLVFCSKISQAVYQLLGVHKPANRSCHSNAAGSSRG